MDEFVSRLFNVGHRELEMGQDAVVTVEAQALAVCGEAEEGVEELCVVG